MSEMLRQENNLVVSSAATLARLASVKLVDCKVEVDNS